MVTGDRRPAPWRPPAPLLPFAHEPPSCFSKCSSSSFFACSSQPPLPAPRSSTRNSLFAGLKHPVEGSLQNISSLRPWRC
eukprot:7379499-Prymnesium_polylepis.2